MATIAELMIHLGVSTKDVRKDAAKAAPEAEAAGKKAGDKFASGFSSAARALKGILATAMAAVSIGAVAHGVNDVVKTASDLNETASKTGVLFGSATGEIMKFAEGAATAIGQSKQAALDGASTFAVYGRGAGLAGSNLVSFSTKLVGLASDMASFANTSPEEAIQAIGAAMRGEMDPIEKYGVLLNEATLKQTALRMGLIKTTTAALTPQQKVLAVNTALLEQLGKKGTDTIGDFARTSESLANQQRILTANWTNMKATVGSALLPIMTSLTSELNTRLMPALQELWATHGQEIVTFLKEMASKAGPAIGQLIDKIMSVDWPAVLDRAKQALAQLGPQLAQFSENSGPLKDTLSVGGVLFGFLADNLDLVAKALPYVIAGFLIYKTVQGAANAMQVAAMPVKIWELLTIRKQTAAMRTHTAALMQNTAAARVNNAATLAGAAAENVGMMTRIRAVASMVAMRAAMIAKAVATGIATAAQWLLNIAMAPVTLTILAIALVIGLLVAGILWLWRNNEGFRNFVLAAWSMIQKAFEVVVNWIKEVAIPFIVGWFKMWINLGLKVADFISTWVGRIVGFFAGLRDKVGNAASGMWDGIIASAKGAINKVISIWNSLDLGFTVSVPDWIPAPFGGKKFSVPDLFPDLPMLAGGGFTPATPGGHLAVLGEGADDEITAPEPKMRQWIRETIDAVTGGTSGGQFVATVRAKDKMSQWLEDKIEVVVERVLDGDAAAIDGGVRF